ncbi:unnamed protein product [Symbiodinium sp. KB8]|nr:unnamed protein product [Symbiodinium sp. KB8]
MSLASTARETAQVRVTRKFLEVVETACTTPEPRIRTMPELPEFHLEEEEEPAPGGAAAQPSFEEKHFEPDREMEFVLRVTKTFLDIVEAARPAPQPRVCTMPALPEFHFEEEEEPAPGHAVAEPSFEEKHFEPDDDQKLGVRVKRTFLEVIPDVVDDSHQRSSTMPILPSLGLEFEEESEEEESFGAFVSHAASEPMPILPSLGSHTASEPMLCPSLGLEFEEESEEEESFGAFVGHAASEPIPRSTPIFHPNLAEPVVGATVPQRADTYPGPFPLHMVEQHNNGRCFPCIFFSLKGNGCRKGDDCTHCHVCRPHEIRRRRNRIAAEMKAARQHMVSLSAGFHVFPSFQPTRSQLLLPPDPWTAFITKKLHWYFLSRVQSLLEPLATNAKGRAMPVAAVFHDGSRFVLFDKFDKFEQWEALDSVITGLPLIKALEIQLPRLCSLPLETQVELFADESMRFDIGEVNFFPYKVSRMLGLKNAAASSFAEAFATMVGYAPVVKAEQLLDLEHVVGPMSDSSSDSDTEPARWYQRMLRPALALSALGAMMLLAGGGMQYMRGDLHATQEKTGMYKNDWTAPKESDISGFDPRSINSINALTGGKGHAPAFSTNPLAPPEDLLDGNRCADDEELLGKLCYKKCSLLTDGKAPIRLSAFSCGKSRGFADFFAAKVGTLVPCEGYDVSGDEAGNGCPHKAGTCLVNEEFSLGKCYKRCEDLTVGQYPHRTSADTCCKTKNFLECIDPSNSHFSFGFNVGGGKGAESKSHSPNTKYTELGH